MQERTLLSVPEKRVLGTFRRFLMNSGQMLCFSGPDLKQNKATLTLLTDKEMLVEEKFYGGYSLTHSGYLAMNDCE